VSKPIDPLTAETTDQTGFIHQNKARLLAALPTAKTLTRATAAVQLQKVGGNLTRLVGQSSKTK
jgi:hypothetical protein